MTLEIQNISKKYNSEKFGLKDFSLKMENGILGLLGPNGAGKSTFLKIIATVSKPTNGSIALNKNNIVKDPNYMRQQLGFLPQDFGVYPNLNAFEFLAYMAAMKGVGGKQLKPRITQLLESLNLTEVAKRPIRTYSGGMKQRVGIAQALLNDPKVLILDEPTVGLDPEERVRFRNLIFELAGNCIVILSSHIVSDIETIADQVAVMKKGNLINAGSQESIITQVDGRVFESTIPRDQLAAFKNQYTVVNTTRTEGAYNVRYISEKPAPHSIQKQEKLEDAYLYLTANN